MFYVIQKYLNFEHNYIDDVHPHDDGIFNLSSVKITTDKINLVDLSQNYTSPSNVLALDVAFKKLNINYKNVSRELNLFIIECLFLGETYITEVWFRDSESINIPAD